MSPTRVPSRRSTLGAPVLVRQAVAFAVPAIAALAVAGTYAGKEVVVAAALASLGIVGVLFVRPVIGIAVMTAGFMLATYPTLLEALGVLTVNNLLGMGFMVLLAMDILDRRDFSFLRNPQIRVLIAIGIVFLVGAALADLSFPNLVLTRGKRVQLDRTADMAHDFVTRLVFLVLAFVFVRTRRDIRLVFLTFMFSLFVAVPSAVVNWLQGNLVGGFRAAATLTTGANPNRLAMICLTEVGLWWCWANLRPTRWRSVLAMIAIAASVVIVFASGSRSGLIGFGVLLLLLRTGPRAYRVPMRYVGLIAAVAVVGVLVVVPAGSWERMVNFAPERHTFGYRSTMMREDTILLGLQMFRDHPLLGIGLGNFREVARQVYLNPFFRPPHNSYLWALAEGGILAFAGYAVLLGICWRDIGVAMRRAQADPEMALVAAGLRVAFGMFLFFSLFADNFMSPITHILIAQVIVLRRYVDQLEAAPRGIVHGRTILPVVVPAAATS